MRVRDGLLAFLGVVTIAGLNFVAVHESNRELAPFWGAALRFGIAALLFAGYAAFRRIPFPRDRALLGVVLYGVLGFFAGYALAYYALVDLSPGLASIVMATVPLLTVLLASLQGQERLTLRPLVGALVALVGIGVIFAEGLRAAAPLLALLAMLAAAVSAAQTSIVVKRFPRPHPAIANAVGMGVGAALLAGLSLAAREPWVLPRTSGPWIALVYLILVGSVAMFFLFLLVLDTWTATAASYMFVLSPIVAIAAGAIVSGAPVTLLTLAGAAIVGVGVWVGALSSPVASAAAAPAASR